MKHFKLRTDLKKELFEVTLFQIEATIEGKWGPKGTLGGFIEKESNLNDNAWVSGNAQVSGEAQVSGNALVYGQAQVFGDALVYGQALVYGEAQVFGEAQVCGQTLVCGQALVSGEAQVYGQAQVSGEAQVSGNAQVSGEAQVSGNALVSGQARVEKYGQCIVINNLKNIITCMPNRIQIGCKDFPTLDKFEETYKQIAKENNYTAEEAEQTANFVRIAMKNMIPIQKSVKVSYNG